MTGIEALKKQSLFSWINNAPLEFLVEKSETRSLLNGDLLYKGGTPGDAIYLILQGDIEFNSAAGKSTTLTQGCIFGECSVIELKDRICEAKAKGNTSVMVLSHEVLYQFSEKFPDPYSIVITNLARCLATRIRNLNDQKATTVDKDTKNSTKPDEDKKS